MTSRQIAVLEKITDRRNRKLRNGRELPRASFKLVSPYIAMHSAALGGPIRWPGGTATRARDRRILPERTLPYLPDGDAGEEASCFNRWACLRAMNVGQYLEDPPPGLGPQRALERAVRDRPGFARARSPDALEIKRPWPSRGNSPARGKTKWFHGTDAAPKLRTAGGWATSI